jgi:hypothetical protein
MKGIMDIVAVDEKTNKFANKKQKMLLNKHVHNQCRLIKDKHIEFYDI